MHENGDLLADSQISILICICKNYFSQVFNVHNVSDIDRLRGLLVIVPDCRCPGSIPALSEFLRSSGSGTGPLSLVGTSEELLGRKKKLLWSRKHRIW
jgi:hypothetical protein